MNLLEIAALAALGYVLLTQKGSMENATGATGTVPTVPAPAFVAPSVSVPADTKIGGVIPVVTIPVTPAQADVTAQKIITGLQPTNKLELGIPAAPAAQTSTPQQISNQVQQSFGVKSTVTINKIVVPVTNNQAQNTNNALRAAKGLPPL